MLSRHPPAPELLHRLSPLRGASGTERRHPPGARLVFEASCRPLSWSLYGVHARTLPPAISRASHFTGRLPRKAVRAQAWDRSHVTELLHAAGALAGELGGARLWLWCPDGLPSPRILHLMAGQAVLSGISLESLGLEVSAEALRRMGDTDRDRVIALRAVGLDVAARLVGDDHDLAASVSLAHEMRMAVLAGEVQDRPAAVELGNLGISAIAGPVVCPGLDLESLRRFLGPRDPSLDRIRADSI